MVRVPILRFSEILPEGWVPGGIIILTRETKIAEMNLSEPFKNDFQSSEKSVEKKIKILHRKSWFFMIFECFGSQDRIMYRLKKNILISYQIPRFCCHLWGTVSSPVLVRFYIFLMFWKATTLIHSFLAILSSPATLGWHPTIEFKKWVFLCLFF